MKLHLQNIKREKSALKYIYIEHANAPSLAVGVGFILPYVTPRSLPSSGEMVHLRKIMTFCVNVPVLSEKMYSICPRSSESDAVRASAGVFVMGSYLVVEGGR